MLLWAFRLQLLHRVQLYCIEQVKGDAIFSNAGWAGTHPALAGHRLLTLRGTDRFFPHRVNSLRRLRYLYGDFKGFECDLQLQRTTGRLYITHGDIRAGDVTLQQFLQADPDRKIFWLDVKNLDTGNVQVFCRTLQQLDRQYGIRERILVESPSVEALAVVRQHGFLTSYYLPLAAGSRPDGDRLRQLCRQGTAGAALLSQDRAFYSAIQKACPGKPQLTWDLSFRHSLDRQRLLHYANDPGLVVCLLNIKSPGYR